MDADAILEELRSFSTLARVVPWALARTPPAEFVAVVVQDEFTHDVVLRVALDIFVVFDTT